MPHREHAFQLQQRDRTIHSAGRCLEATNTTPDRNVCQLNWPHYSQDKNSIVECPLRESKRMKRRYWRHVLRQAYWGARAYVREHWGRTVALVAGLVTAVVCVRLFGSDGAWLDDAISAAAVLAIVSSTFGYLFLKRLIAIPAEMHDRTMRDRRRAEEEVSRLRSSVATVAQTQTVASMDMRELSLHLHGRVRQFVQIEEYDARYAAVDVAVRDALSVGHLRATGRPIDWRDKLASYQTTRSRIDANFWTNRGDLDWGSVSSDDPYHRAIAMLDGEEQFYDLSFERSDVDKLWPEDSNDPLDFLRLGELAETALGYDFCSKRSHTLSLIAGIRENAAQGKLDIVGRRGCFGRSQESAYFYPLVPIAKEHFEDYWINIPGLFVLIPNPQNWDVYTRKPGDEHWQDEAYLDLHFADRHQALNWLLTYRPKRLQPGKE